MKKISTGVLAVTMIGIALTLGACNIHISRDAPATLATNGSVRILLIDEKGRDMGHGSGTHIGQGRILTANHVIEAAAESKARMVVVDHKTDAMLATDTVVLSRSEA